MHIFNSSLMCWNLMWLCVVRYRYPYVTGTSIIGIKYKDGVLIAADMGGILLSSFFHFLLSAWLFHLIKWMISAHVFGEGGELESVAKTLKFVLRNEN